MMMIITVLTGTCNFFSSQFADVLCQSTDARPDLSKKSDTTFFETHKRLAANALLALWARPSDHQTKLLVHTHRKFEFFKG